jgi:hypothetical protein
MPRQSSDDQHQRCCRQCGGFDAAVGADYIAEKRCFSKRHIALSAAATDNISVAKVEMYVDGSLKAVSNSASLSTRWNTKNAGSGSHVLTAKAYDAVGNVGTISITVTK